MRPPRLLHLWFAVSGAAGLVHQVTWVRQFALVFGNSVQSASIVTATFLGGLGVGGWLAGRWADRNRGRELWAWGGVEIAIGVLGAMVAWVLPQWSAGVGTMAYTLSDAGWYELTWMSLVVRTVCSTGLIAAPAALMGATLTLLIRAVTDKVREAGWRVAGLYAWNTLGAALGAVATDVLLVPWVGLRATQGVAVAANVTIGAVALGWAWTYGTRVGAARPESAVSALRSRNTLRVAGALALAGFAAMGLELVWFRFLAGALGPYRAVFAVLLGVLLLGNALGAAISGALVRRFGCPERWFAGAQAAMVVTAIAGLVLYDPYSLLERQHAIADDYVAASALGRAWLLHSTNAVTIALVVALPAVAMGASFPLGNAMAQDAAARVGARAGALYLATTAGNVAGALITGFVLLPGPGLQFALMATCGVAVAAALVVAGPRLEIVPAAIAWGGGLMLPAYSLLWATFPYGRAKEEGVLEIREGLEQIVVVTGSPEGPARLWTNGHPMTSTSPHAQRYMRSMAHVPLLMHDDPQRVLVICVGAGNTVHAASLHPVSHIEAVDLSQDVLAVGRWFAHSHQNVFDDARVHTFVNDGRHHLTLRPPGHFDLITLEPPPLAASGVSGLYAEEFYRLAASRLSDDGYVVQWLPAYQVPEQAVRSLVRAFVNVFPEAVLLVGSGRELLLLGGHGKVVLDPDVVATRLLQRPAVAEDLARLGLGDVRELATMFAAPASVLRKATEGVRPVQDDRPVLEHAQASHLMTTELPPDLFAPERWPSYCPDCRGIAPVMRVAAQVYASDAFLGYSAIRSDPTSRVPAPAIDDATLAVIASSATLTRAVVAPDALALRAQELWTQGKEEAAWLHLDAAQTQAPGVPLLVDLAESWRLK